MKISRFPFPRQFAAFTHPLFQRGQPHLLVGMNSEKPKNANDKKKLRAALTTVEMMVTPDHQGHHFIHHQRSAVVSPIASLDDMVRSQQVQAQQASLQAQLASVAEERKSLRQERLALQKERAEEPSAFDRNDLPCRRSVQRWACRC